MRARPAHFQVRATRAGDTLTVAIHGEFDLAAVPDFHLATRESLPPRWQLVVDLRAATFMDGSALRALTSLNERSGRQGFELTILAPRYPAYRVIELTGMGEHLPIVGAPEHR